VFLVTSIRISVSFDTSSNVYTVKPLCERKWYTVGVVLLVSSIRQEKCNVTAYNEFVTCVHQQCPFLNNKSHTEYFHP
jgi:hypothetical protein